MAKSDKRERIREAKIVGATEPFKDILFRRVKLRSGGSKLHAHNYYEMMIVVSGSGYHITEEGEYELKRGTVLISSPEYAHGARKCDNLEIINIIYEGHCFDDGFDDMLESQGFTAFFGTLPKLSDKFRFQNNFILSESNIKIISGLAAEMESEQKQKRPGWHFALKTFFRYIILSISRTLENVDNFQHNNILRINGILQFIEEHHDKPIRAADVAEACDIPMRSLDRLFKNSLNTTPTAYINNLKLEKAAGLLLETDYRIIEISSMLGFSDSCYLTKLFTRKYSVAPLAYRNKFAR